MKAIFIRRQGALVEGSGALTFACNLHCGAGAGLRILAELDFRLIVIDDGGDDDTAAGRAVTAGRDSIDEGQYGATGFGHTPGDKARRADNGCRRRRLDRPPGPDIAHADVTARSRGAPQGAEAYTDDVVTHGAQPVRHRAAPAPHDNDGINVPDYEQVEHALGGDKNLQRWCSLMALGTFQGRHDSPVHSAAGTFPAHCAVPGSLADRHDAGTAGRIDQRLNSHGRSSGSSGSGGGNPNRMADRVIDLLFREQLIVHAYYCCRHDAAPPRRYCRPPQPGLLLQAAYDHNIDLAASWLIGATLDDVEAGNRAGCRTVLIDNGSETIWRLGRGRVSTRIAPDIFYAARLIEQEDER